MDSAMRRGCTGECHCCLLREAVSWKITDSFAFLKLEEEWAIIYLNLINRSALKAAVHFPGRHSQDASSALAGVQVEIPELRPLCSWPPSIPPPPKLRVDQKIFFGSLATSYHRVLHARRGWGDRLQSIDSRFASVGCCGGRCCGVADAVV